MKKNTSILPDELFNEGFLSHEAPFDPASWEHMKTLLDEDDLNPVMIVPQTNQKNDKKTLFIITIMTTLSLFSIATWMLLGNNNQITDVKTHNSYPTETGIEHTTQLSPNTTSTLTLKNEAIKADRSLSSTSILNDQSLFKRTMIKSPIKEQQPSQNQSNLTEGELPPSGSSPFKDSVRMVTTDGKTYRVLVRKIWVPEEYEYITKPRAKTVQDFWIGLHFTAQKPLKSDTMSAGFNMQFMSGNRLQHQYWALYGGFDWGMQFYGKGKKSNVVLNNTTQDSGFTRLRTYSMDLLGRAHLEYARYALVPYVNAFAGPRIYSTGQTVSSYLDLKQTESSTSHNAHTSVSMMYGLGVGARLRLSPYISLDARYEIMSGTPVRLVDMNQSTFNGLNYDLKINKVTPRYEQFKFGIIFDISSDDYDKKIAKEGYYKEYSYDSLYVDPKDSNKVYLPCNCAPCSTSVEEHSRIYEETPATFPQNRGNNGGSSGGSNNGGSSRGSFPGIKPPSKPTEKIPR